MKMTFAAMLSTINERYGYHESDPSTHRKLIWEIARFDGDDIILRKVRDRSLYRFKIEALPAEDE
jgi:hypothetical protein